MVSDCDAWGREIGADRRGVLDALLLWMPFLQLLKSRFCISGDTVHKFVLHVGIEVEFGI